MIRTLKKLKIWSRLKRKRRKTHDLQQTDHSCHCCSCSAWHPQPTAPPLPPWADFDQAQEAVSCSFAEPGVSPSHSELPPVPSEIVPSYVPLPVSDASYQQYLVPSPVYGVPLLPVASREGDFTRFWGCVAGAATRLTQCLCNCLP